jgi:uncharacterized membrane protein (UPF0127 family)
MPERVVRNRTTNVVLAGRVVCCDTFWKRGRGLMFHRPLAEDEAYLFVLARPSVADAAIHMFFVTFPIAVVWLNAEKRVIHRVLARPWRPYYAPPKPALYFLEGPPGLLSRVEVGEVLEW